MHGFGQEEIDRTPLDNEYTISTGDWEYGKMTGRGYYYKKKGDYVETYRGDMKSGKKDGIGKLTKTSGEFEGDFLDNKYIGSGKLDGSFETFEGDFR